MGAPLSWSHLNLVTSQSAMCSVIQSCLTLCNSTDCSPPGSGLDCHTPLQGIVPTQGLKMHLLCWQAASLPLYHLGTITELGGGLSVTILIWGNTVTQFRTRSYWKSKLHRCHHIAVPLLIFWWILSVF